MIVAPSIAGSVVTWSNLHAGDTGGHVATLPQTSPYGTVPTWTRVQFQVTGILGLGGGLRMEGSTSGNLFLALADAIAGGPFWIGGIITRPGGSLRTIWPPGGDDNRFFYAARLSIIDEVAPTAPEGVQLSNYLRPRVISGDWTTALTLAATFIQ